MINLIKRIFKTHTPIKKARVVHIMDNTVFVHGEREIVALTKDQIKLIVKANKRKSFGK